MSNINNRLITYTIYLITNEINGKNYVGKHKLQKNESIKSRRYMGSGAALNRAKQKYGIENFSKEILAICYSEKEENILETQYIALYKSIGKAEYNETSGGEKCDYWNYFSEERKSELKEVFRQNTSKMWEDEEYREKLVKAHKGTPNKMKGKHYSDEVRERVSQAHIGIKQSEETKRKISEFNKGKIISNVQKKQISAKNKGRHYFNNGIIEVKQYECPEGFVPGRIPKDRSLSEESKQKIREARAKQVFSEESLAKRSESIKKSWQRRKVMKTSEIL